MKPEKLKLGFEGNTREVDANPPPDAPPPWDAATKHAVVGRDHPRLDAVAKVTGAATYAYDVRLPGMVYARLLGSPHACARVESVDLTRAKALPGVVHAEETTPRGGVVRFAGQAVAGLAAETEEQLDDAIAAIDVEYEVLPHAVTTADAMADGAPLVRPRGDSNVQPAGRGPQGNREAVERAHAGADVVLEREYTTQVQVHTPLETHGSVAQWKDGTLTVWASTQATFGFRGAIAQAMGLSAEDVTVITEYMGGGFGSKFGPDTWDVFAARVARATGRPCKALLDRRTEHLVAGMRPDSRQKLRFSAKQDGTLCGAEVRSWGTPGVGGGAGVANPAVYRFGATWSEQYEVLTHAGGARAFRAPGHPQGFFALESMIDELAEAVGMDPVAFRKKNDPHPVRQAQYDVGAKAIGWERRRKNGAAEGPVRRGLGMSASRWHHSVRPGAAVDCRIGRDGSVTVANGAQDLGTGTRTVLAVLAAEELGLQPADVTVRLGNTNDPVGNASGGSQTAPSLAPAVRHAAWLAKRKLLDAVAAKTGADAAALALQGGQVVGGPEALSFRKACSLLDVDAIETRGQHEPAHSRLPRFADEVAGVQFAEVEVDTVTGRVRVLKVVAVQDCGLVVDGLLARSQINGGVIQGVSYALYEQHRLDRNTGDTVNGNFLDYKIVGARECPEIVSIPFSVANGISHTGVSSLGEPPTVPTAAAIANAVANALGVRVRSLPITPDRVLAALEEF